LRPTSIIIIGPRENSLMVALNDTKVSKTAEKNRTFRPKVVISRKRQKIGNDIMYSYNGRLIESRTASGLSIGTNASDLE